MTWRSLRVSPDATHHLRGDEPAYPGRFDEVLSFHSPGLAAVRRGDQAWHIDVDGAAAYDRRFQRTFGYYEGLATVIEPEGWHLIRTDGSDLDGRRWSWCGNLQDGRCVVREVSGTYLHVRPDGAPAYEARWRYAGDFRHGVAVAQRDDGRCTHIDRDGRAIHGTWFRDLDVFHKGFARARDERGWHHVDRGGRPIHPHRFAMAEPFYNGQARVETHDGTRLVIDESGRTLVTLSSAADAFHAVSAELVSFWRCEAVQAAVTLGVFETLPLREPAPRLERLLGALGELGLVRLEDGAWVATAAGALLRSDHPRSLVSAARYWSMAGRRGWDALPEAITASAWDAPDPFADASTSPAVLQAMHAALETYAEHDYTCIQEGIPVERGVVIDAGGGTGALAKSLLRARPGLSAVVMDRPEVTRLGTIPDDLEGRLSFAHGDLFLPWPVRGDAIVLARVLHDWPDEACVRILEHATAALKEGGTLYLVEFIRPRDRFDGGLLSLHLMLTTGGQERTLEEFRALLQRAGLTLAEQRHVPGMSTVLLARPR